MESSIDAKRLKILNYIEENIDSISIDEIKEWVSKIMIGITFRTPLFYPGTFVYRARKVDENFNTSTPISLADLKYPPASRTRIGRANREGYPMFYCSMSKEPIFFEIGNLKAGDEIIISSWKTTSSLLVNNIGYTKFVFSNLKSKRECPTWGDNKNGKCSITMPLGGDDQLSTIHPRSENEELILEISRLFMRNINDSAYKYYKLTAAIAEAHLGTVNYVDNISGIIYPSVRMWANSDNLALTPAFVDDNLEFRRATHVRIDSLTTTGFDITNTNCAREFDDSGHLKWLGRRLNWQVPPGGEVKVTLTEGKDLDGEYSISKDGVPCHFVVEDIKTGKEIEIS